MPALPIAEHRKLPDAAALTVHMRSTTRWRSAKRQDGASAEHACTKAAIQCCSAYSILLHMNGKDIYHVRVANDAAAFVRAHMKP
jgi:hypothetical protein